MEQTGTSASPSRIAMALVERARLTPHRAAAWDVDRCLTYAELEAVVGTLALEIAERQGLLGACGVLPVMVGRDVGSLVAVHAAIRSGVPFCPLDRGLAPAALAALLHRIDDPKVAVAAGPTGLPHDVTVLQPLPHPSVGLAPVPVLPEKLAWIVFTSGSLGAPKGVATSQRAVDAVLDDPLYAPPSADADVRALAMAPMSFVAGLLHAVRVARGIAVSILDPHAHDPLDLLERIDADRLEMVAVVPSHIPTIVARWPAGRRIESVRSITAFGEALEWSMVPDMRRLAPESAVIQNLYGSSEAGRGGLVMRIDAGMPLGSGRVPLGRPVEDGIVRFEELRDGGSDLLEVVALGSRVATGYWRDPELTARSFGVDSDGARFWRSGDLVRLDGDGLARFVGRRDNVVKINGKLVEPSEPERVLGEVEGIRRAVVLVQPAPRGGQRLVAHLEVEPATAADPAMVRRAVVDQVAPHLVPAVIVRHDALPLTTRGKVDRQRLIRAKPAPWRAQGSDRMPTMDEAAVLGVVCDLLGLEGVGPDDDLWELGLDSLGATELLATLEGYGWPAMPESVLLDHRTVADIDVLRRGSIRNSDIRLNAGASGGRVICVLAPTGDPLTFRQLAQCVGSEHQIDIVHQVDFFAAAPPPRTVEEIAVALRGRLGPLPKDRSSVIVGYSGSGVVAYELSRRYASEGSSVCVVLLDSPAGADAGVVSAERTEREAVSRRIRRVSRQAWLRALPPATMPQRKRARTVYEVTMRAARSYRPPRTDLTVVMFVARNSGFTGLADGWAPLTPGLCVADLDCDHFTILGRPHIDQVADRIRAVAG